MATKSRKTPALAESCCAILREHLEAMRAHESGTRAGDESEELHQMRVSSRRLRAALRVFRSALRNSERKALDRELKWIDNALGSVRDLDVLTARMHRNRTELRPAPAEALLAVVDAIGRRRESARAEMIVVLDSDRYRGFVESFHTRLGNEDEALFAKRAARDTPEETAVSLVGAFLRDAMQATGAVSTESVPEALHDARKVVRRLRYGLEFFGPLWGKPAKRMLKLARRVQDELGEHQDAYVAQDVLASIAEELRAGPEGDAAVFMAIGETIQREEFHALEARGRFFELRDEFVEMARSFSEKIAG